MSKVLVVDRSTDLVESLIHELTRAGYEVLTALSEDQVSSMARAESPDVVLLGDGVTEFTNLLQSWNAEDRLRDIPILVLVDEERSAEAVLALDAGARDVLPRRFDHPVILARVRAAIRDLQCSRAIHGIIRRLEESRDDAERRSSSRSEFLANMSHEVRTPLTSILGYTDLLLDASSTAKERLTWIQTIRHSGEHLLTIINDVLDISKIEAGRMTVEQIDVDPFQVLEEVQSLMRPRANEKKLEFQIATDDPLPARIKSDPTRLRQILVNLVGNAVKFTNSGSVSLSCRLEQESGSEPMLRFEVQDSGIGMSTEEGHSIFQPFHQADRSVARRYGGTGLGLVITRRLVELLGGGISFESEVGVGSTFRVSVPTGSLDGVALVSSPAASIQEVGEEDTQTPSSRRRRIDARILLAEDVPANQRLVRFFLRRTGAQIDVAEDGQVAVDKFLAARDAGQPYDLVLMDMQMPKMDGYTATARLRSEGFVGPVVALTAHALQGEREKCLAAGCDEFATKPITRECLEDLVADQLPDHVTIVEKSESRAAGESESPPSEDDDSAADAAPIRSELLDLMAGDVELVRLVECFARELPSKIADLERHLDSRDDDSLMALCHQLKGAAGGYGFSSMSHRIDELETLARDEPGERDQMRGLVERIRTDSLRIRI